MITVQVIGEGGTWAGDRQRDGDHGKVTDVVFLVDITVRSGDVFQRLAVKFIGVLRSTRSSP